MSWEGYEFIFCENGHRNEIDPHSYLFDDPKCPVCNGEIIRTCAIETTNGDDEERKQNERNQASFERFVKKFFNEHKDIYIKVLKDEIEDKKKFIENIEKEINKLYKELEKVGSSENESLRTLKSYVGKSFTGTDGMTILILGYSEGRKSFWGYTYEGNIIYFSLKDLKNMKETK